MHLKCVDCGATYDPKIVRYVCDCGGTLDVVHDLERVRKSCTREMWDARLGSRARLDRSGVWRFRELILPLDEQHVASRGEGNTTEYCSAAVSEYTGVKRITLKHEGENPTGSFKDRGMTSGVTAARWLGQRAVACASTGNTSASLASFAALMAMQAVVFIPDGQIAYGKLGQTLAYGARTLQVAGDFDAAMALARAVCEAEGIYLLNSVNPFRLEGQKAIAFELLQDREWRVPDWIVLPGGNLGNNSAITKGLQELYALGWIDRLPRVAVVQAQGANPLYTAFTSGADVQPVVGAKTVATAIQIGDPVSWRKSLRGIAATQGTVTEADDGAILDAKAVVDGAGIGAEPASCATVAGVRRLVQEGVIKADDEVVGILTGNLLKDPDVVVRYHRGEIEGADAGRVNTPIRCDATVDAVMAALRQAC
ncbi:MAG: threonine synthase [Bradymonadia bacterium]